jgi:DNA-binding MurR/RpiR family transcriptional regulator
MKELLKVKSSKLTPSQKKVLKYILNNPEDSVFLTASALGRKTRVSEATIIRLAQRLGFNGFPDFQRSLREHLQERLTTVSRLEKTLEHPQASESLIGILKIDIKNISLMAESISEKTFQNIVTHLWKAKRIFVIGLRSAYGLAVYLKFGLRFLGKEITLLEPVQWDLWDQLNPLGPQTLVVAISFPRYARMTIDAVAFAKEKRCKILSITDSLVSPLTAYSDWILVAPCQSYSYMDSFTAPMALIHTLLTAMSLKKPDKALQAFKNLEEIWDQQGVYYSPSGKEPPLP